MPSMSHRAGADAVSDGRNEFSRKLGRGEAVQASDDGERAPVQPVRKPIVVGLGALDANALDWNLCAPATLAHRAALP
jgi:hypothetical protein